MPYSTIHSPDVIIVGSGAGGGTAAHLLTERGKSVVVFEKGPMRRPDDFLPYDELHFHGHKALIPQVHNDPNIYIGKDGKPKPVERWWTVNMVGGSTMVWDANMPRYTREDFEVLSFLPQGFEEKDNNSGISMVNWPWTYDSFQEYFEKAERVWGVAGKARQCPQQEPVRDSYEYPMPPLRAHAATEFMMKAFGKAGMTPYHGPRAINSQTHDGRPACPFCGFNQFFGCAVSSRANSPNTVLARALATGRCDLRTGHCVTRLVYDKPAGSNGKARIRGVMYKTQPDGPEYFLGASKVFVSIQTIESARLFLISEIPDPNKMVGRYLTYHTHANLEFTFKDQPAWVDENDPATAFQPRTALGSLQLRDLYVVNDPKEPDIRKAGKFSIYDEYTTVPPIRLIKGASFSGNEKNLWGKRLQERLREFRAEGGVYFSFTGDALSLYDNRVELDPDVKDPWGLPAARTYYRHHEYDLKACDYALKRVSQAMTDAGGELRKYEPQPEDNPGYGHVHGTLRAGADPGKAVLDADCQSHTVDGLYVLDAAFMPTAGASNPSMTLLANAFRVCENVPL